MTTTTTQPPTEEEIRALVEARWRAAEGSSGTRGGDLRDALRDLIDDAGQWLRYPAWSALADAEDAGPEDVDDDPRIAPLWRDLRRSEARRLTALLAEAADRAAERCEAIVLEELTAAGVQFTSEHPEAPRP